MSDIEIKDTYHPAVKEMIQAKVEGKEVVMAGEDEVKPVVDIMTALRESIEAAKGDAKPLERATGEAEAEETETGKPVAKKAPAKKRAAAKSKAKPKTKSKSRVA